MTDSITFRKEIKQIKFKKNKILFFLLSHFIHDEHGLEIRNTLFMYFDNLRMQ